jgi:predicted CXXCH cytochrome family protein
VTRTRLLEALVVLLGLGVGLSLVSRKASPEPASVVRKPEGGYLGSEGCQMCHPKEHESWHGSHHRSMTRRARDLAWDGRGSPTLPVTLEDRHFRFRLLEDGSRLVARGPDLHRAAQHLYLAREQAIRAGEAVPSPAAIERALEQVPEVERPIELVTGSHHYLAFWISAGSGRELRQLPFVYHLNEAKWSPRSEAFLEPPDAPPYIATWNSNCIQCHAVAGQPRQREWRDDDGALHVRFESRVAELGIACEACHGPGRSHAEYFRNPLSRVRSEAAPPSARLLNPAAVDSATGSSVCGQCHAYFVPTDEPEFWETGYSESYEPGDPLSTSRQLLTLDGEPKGTPVISRELESIFWPDGTMRVGGREYAGLVASACFTSGAGKRKLGCVSCHSMHDSAPDDQLLRDVAKDQNAPCRSCHQDALEHSQHAPGSIGTSCVDCHMPKTTYALLGSIRSHRVQIPRPAETSVPSACALCHVDRPLSWLTARSADAASSDTSDPLHAAGSEDVVPVGFRGALSGNAAERAIYAAALASKETRQTIGDGLARALLERLRHDRYHAVRRIAERGLSALPRGTTAELDEDLVRRLEAERDDRDVVISE